MIVVFDDTVPFQSFAGEFRPDDRAAANPPAWGYLDRGVAGAAQHIERRHGFRAYSAAIRGFSARLTAQQIAELERPPRAEVLDRLRARPMRRLSRMSRRVQFVGLGDRSDARTRPLLQRKAKMAAFCPLSR